MKKRLLGLTIITGLIFFSGCGKRPQLKNGEEIIGKIDGMEFTVDDVYKNLKKQHGTTALINMIDDFIVNKEIKDDKEALEYANAQLAEIKMNFTNDQEYLEALQSSGFKNDDELIENIKNGFKREQVADKYFSEKITTKEIEKYYNEEVSEELDVRHILIQPDADDDVEAKEKEALDKANDLIKQLNEGASFEELAKEHSADGSSEDGGLIKGVTKDKYVKEFFDAALKLKKNEWTTKPVKTQYGYHIILKLNEKPKPTLEEAKDYIIDSLIEEKKQEENAFDKIWVEIRKKYNLNILDKDIKTNYDLIANTF